MEIEAIVELIKQDEENRTKLDTLQKEKEDLSEALNIEKEKISKETWDSVHKEIENKRKELESKIGEDSKENKERFEKEAKRLEDIYNSKKDEWVNSLYKMVVEGNGENK